MRTRDFFEYPYLERASQLRADPRWLDAAWSDPRSRVLPVWRAQNLFYDGSPPGVAHLPVESVRAAPHSRHGPIFLGLIAGVAYFALALEGDAAPELLQGTHFEDVRGVATWLGPGAAGLLSYARAMVLWHSRNVYCAVCGHLTRSNQGGHFLICSNPDCNHRSYPRVDPAVIVLVTDGARALLGRQSHWPARRYSVIAGFVEPGESLEDAVAREVHEETGVEVDEIHYFSSQTWPFPSSLMLGFTARATGAHIGLRDKELEAARWVSREELANQTVLPPPAISIATPLIESWFNAGWPRPLHELHDETLWGPWF